MRRNNLDIFSDILTIASNGAKKTQIVYKCNLNFKILAKYLLILSEKKLIEKQGKLYYTTPLGNEFVSKYRKLINPLNDVLETVSY